MSGNDQAATIKQNIFRIYDLIYGNWKTCVVYAFAELGIADHLAGTAKTPAQLGQETGTDARMLMRLLRCVAALELVCSDAGTGAYSLTPLGEMLRSDHPYSLRAAARLNGAPYRYEPWGKLVEILRAGSAAGFSPTYEKGSLDYLADKPALREVFHQAMNDLSGGQNEPLARAYDFAPFTHAIELGSGRGALIRAILRAAPHLRGTMFDLPDTLAGEQSQDSESLAGRLQQQAGDFMASVPAGGDVYVMKNVIHNWPEEKAVRLLQNVRAAMMSDDGPGRPQDRRLLVIEHLVPKGDGQSIAKWLDLNFMILIDGAERTLDEYRDLAQHAGLSVIRAIPTPVGRHIIELALDLPDGASSPMAETEAM